MSDQMFQHNFDQLARYENGRTPVLLTEDQYRRARACVNACSGIETELLEIVSDNDKTLTGIIASLEKQRDELLSEKDQNDFALLKSMLEIFDIMGNPTQFRHALNMAVEKRAAAIASVKGSAS